MESDRNHAAPEMLRVALSIGAGRIRPSTILRRLATYSRKNKLYFAFRELGRVVRTVFLLDYISDIDLRRTIQTATNKSEAFNLFVQWVAFGGGRLLAENTRDEQRKMIKCIRAAKYTVDGSARGMREVFRSAFWPPRLWA
jgi:TnpA family transposase